MQRNSKTQMKKTITKHKRIPVSDKIFIDFYRCLYQTKAIVRDLSSFSDSVYPALRSCPNLLSNESPSAVVTTKQQQQQQEEEKESTQTLIKQVNQYLETTFCKFTRLCQILMMVLYKMENSSNTTTGSNPFPTKKRDCIDSFRVEVIEEWKTATSIKERLIHLITFNSDNSIVPVDTQTPTTVCTVPNSTSTSSSSLSIPGSIDTSEDNNNNNNSNNDCVPSIA